MTLISLDQLSFLGESASPFIDKREGFTSERERVCTLLNFVAHAGGYRMMVGAHNTVDVGCTWEVTSSCSGMADVGTCYTVDAQRHVRSFTMFTRYGKCRHPQHCRCPEACGGAYRMGANGAHNTVEGDVGAYNIVCARVVYIVLFLQAYRVWSLES